jgi:prepilin-type N-terminal cleavage/methylation domain-containing protein
MRKNQKGFTLMELMVVIVIVAILAAVAVPLYINYVKDAQRTEAKGAIGAIITAEQAYLQKHGSYATSIADLKAEALDLTDVEGSWTFNLTGVADGTFTVDATGVSGKPTEGLSVTCLYTRGSPPVWTP